MRYTIKNKASLFLLTLGTGIMLFVTPAHAQAAKDNTVYAPMVTNGAKIEARYRIAEGCLYEKYGCTADSVTMVFDNGSAILNGVYACFLPTYGCTPDPRVTVFEDGSAIVYNR